MDNKIILEQLTVCPLCFSAEIKELSNLGVTKKPFGKFKVNHCSQCHITFTNPSIKNNSIPELYKARDAGMDISTNKGFFFYLRSFKLARYIKKIEKLVGKKSYSILDYGCGDGLLGYSFSQSQYCSRVVCADYAETSPFSRQFKDTTYLTYHSLGVNPVVDCFDVIMLRHVVEHMKNPLLEIAQLQNKLNEDGKIVIEVPNFNSFWYKVFKSSYSQLGLPYHLFHFTKESMHRHFGDNFELKFIDVNIPVLGPSLVNIFNKSVNNNVGFAAAIFYPVQLLIDIFLKNKAAMIIVMSPRK